MAPTWAPRYLLDFGDSKRADLSYELVSLHISAFECKKDILKTFFETYKLPTGGIPLHSLSSHSLSSSPSSLYSPLLRPSSLPFLLPIFLFPLPRRSTHHARDYVLETSFFLSTTSPTTPSSSPPLLPPLSSRPSPSSPSSLPLPLPLFSPSSLPLSLSLLTNMTETLWTYYTNNRASMMKRLMSCTLLHECDALSTVFRHIPEAHSLTTIGELAVLLWDL